ncbi:hypothetical protein ACIQUQ_09315 [Streptomyces sp. NPDC101118]|uniref:hypothetical protein n=1 Tax=Streptomyces sp. NPDC101118 TaxID=3366109 RepID=UPI003803B235
MPFEDDLGQALRQTGDGFSTDQRALLDGGERRGRRRLARRRAAAVTGGALTLALVATAGAYAGGLLGGSGSGASVASGKGSGNGGDPGVPERGGSGAVTPEMLIATLKGLLPAGTLTDTRARGTKDQAPYVSGVFDDGKGRSQISVGLSRIDPKGTMFKQMTDCPSPTQVPHDGCTEETLPGGARLLLFRGYVYPDRRSDTKNWRATLATKDGYLIDANEHNAAAEKDSGITRPNPPLTMARMKALVTSDKWHAALADLPAAPIEPPVEAPSGGNVQGRLISLLPKGLKVVEKGDDGPDYTFLVLDDGKGESLVQINVQSNMGDLAGDLFGSGDVTTLPDGTKVKAEKKVGEKGGEGVVWWSVDTLRPSGLRVVVSAFNAPTQHAAASRETPALTMEQLRAIATSVKWK